MTEITVTIEKDPNWGLKCSVCNEDSNPEESAPVCPACVERGKACAEEDDYCPLGDALEAAFKILARPDDGSLKSKVDRHHAQKIWDNFKSHTSLAKWLMDRPKDNRTFKVNRILRPSNEAAE